MALSVRGRRDREMGSDQDSGVVRTEEASAWSVCRGEKGEARRNRNVFVAVRMVGKMPARDRDGIVIFEEHGRHIFHVERRCEKGYG